MNGFVCRLPLGLPRLLRKVFCIGAEVEPRDLDVQLTVLAGLEMEPLNLGGISKLGQPTYPVDDASLADAFQRDCQPSELLNKSVSH